MSQSGSDARQLPTWNPSEDAVPEAALKALDTYKKKDPSKGAPRVFTSFGQQLIRESGGSVQGRGQCADNEAELLQNHRVKSIPSSDTLPSQGAGMVEHRSSGMLSSVRFRRQTIIIIRSTAYIYQPRVLPRA